MTDKEIIDLALQYEFGGAAGGDEPREHVFRDDDIVRFAAALLASVGLKRVGYRLSPTYRNGKIIDHEGDWTNGIPPDCYAAYITENEGWTIEYAYVVSVATKPAASANSIPLTKATRDQIASVMLQTGIPEQKRQALAYVSGLNDPVAQEPVDLFDTLHNAAVSHLDGNGIAIDAQELVRLIETLVIAVRDTAPVVAQPSVPEGWCIVPAAPTKGMLDAAEKVSWEDADTRGDCINQWNVMLAAAPTPPAVEQPNGDPFPWCMPGVFCKSPVCGRLAQAQTRSMDQEDAERWRFGAKTGQFPLRRQQISPTLGEPYWTPDSGLYSDEFKTPEEAIDAARNAGGQS